jgi:hypothetical protein
LAVFAGGWASESAEQVCGADPGEVAGLLEASLVRAHGDRFTMLETVREFAHDKLAELGELTTVGRRHAEHMLELASQARTFARGPREREWLDRLAADVDNLRAAQGFAIETRDAALGVTLAEALEPFWIRGMRQREAVRWLEPLLRLDGDVDRAVRAGALTLAGRSAIEAGDRRRAEPWLREGLELARASGDALRTARALHGLGHLRAEEGDAAEARTLSRRAWSCSCASASTRRPAAA